MNINLRIAQPVALGMFITGGGVAQLIWEEQASPLICFNKGLAILNYSLTGTAKLLLGLIVREFAFK